MKKSVLKICMGFFFRFKKNKTKSQFEKSDHVSLNDSTKKSRTLEPGQSVVERQNRDVTRGGIRHP